MAKAKFWWRIPAWNSAREKWALGITIFCLVVLAFQSKPVPGAVVLFGLWIPRWVLGISIVVLIFCGYSVFYHVIPRLFNTDEEVKTEPPPERLIPVAIDDDDHYEGGIEIPVDATAGEFLTHRFFTVEQQMRETTPMFLKWQDDAYESMIIRSRWLKGAPESVLQDLIQAAHLVLGQGAHLRNVSVALLAAHEARGFPSFDELMNFAESSGDSTLVRELETLRKR